MKRLLDTHAPLWWLDVEARFGQHARIQISDPDDTALISVASLWEIVEVRVGRLQADIAKIEDAIPRDDFLRLEIRPSHLAVLSGLPMHSDYRDPFDHLLIAQAIGAGATFISEDRHAARYPVPILRCPDPVA